jgi:hypothetical protein
MNWRPRDKLGDEPGMSCRTLAKAHSHFSQFRPSGDSTKATASARVENFSPALSFVLVCQM